MNETAPSDIARYLSGLRGVTHTRPVWVEIDGKRFPACFYTQTSPVTPGCRAYAEGQREHTETRLYVAGERTKEMRKQKRIMPGDYCQANVYRMPDDVRDWFTVCHCDQDLRNEPAFAPYHPFGLSFILRSWEVPSGEAIDHYEDKKRTRRAIVIMEAAQEFLNS